MIGVIIDIDDTLIDTQSRTHQIMEFILNQEIPLEDHLSLSQEEVFYRYASEAQKNKVNELRRQFFDLLLCKNDSGIELFKYDKVIPFAVDVLNRVIEKYDVVLGQNYGHF
ncbi:MAG: hypothetical protein ACXADY_19340 [Candidatus Hodarchaeales archaeon]